MVDEAQQARGGQQTRGHHLACLEEAHAHHGRQRRGRDGAQHVALVRVHVLRRAGVWQHSTLQLCTLGGAAGSNTPCMFCLCVIWE